MGKRAHKIRIFSSNIFCANGRTQVQHFSAKVYSGKILRFFIKTWTKVRKKNAFFSSNMFDDKKYRLLSKKHGRTCKVFECAMLLKDTEFELLVASQQPVKK